MEESQPHKGIVRITEYRLEPETMYSTKVKP